MKQKKSQQWTVFEDLQRWRATECVHIVGAAMLSGNGWAVYASEQVKWKQRNIFIRYKNSVRCLALDTYVHTFDRSPTDLTTSRLLILVAVFHFVWYFRTVRPTRNHRFNCWSSFTRWTKSYGCFFMYVCVHWNVMMLSRWRWNVHFFFFENSIRAHCKA